MEAVEVYVRLVSAQLRSQMQYKVSFSLALVGTFLVVVTEFGLLLVLFARVPAIAGWSLGEMSLLYGISGVSFAVAEMIASALDNFEVHLVRGTFDRVLLRPRGALFQCLAEDFTLRRVGRIAQAVLVLAIAFGLLDIRWSADKVGVLLLAVLCGTAIYFAIFVMGAAFCFWTVRAREVVNVFTYGGQTMAGFPMDIYHGAVQRFFTFVVPIAFVGYEPALYLLGRPDPLGLPDIARLLSPLAAALMGLAAWVGWQQGVRHYQSTGS